MSIHFSSISHFLFIFNDLNCYEILIFTCQVKNDPIAFVTITFLKQNKIFVAIIAFATLLEFFLMVQEIR